MIVIFLSAITIKDSDASEDFECIFRIYTKVSSCY